MTTIKAPERMLPAGTLQRIRIAYSSRCLLSGYFNRRDANTGDAMGRERLDSFNFEQEDEDAASRFSSCGSVQRQPEADKVWLIEEKERSGELIPAMIAPLM